MKHISKLTLIAGMLLLPFSIPAQAGIFLNGIYLNGIPLNGIPLNGTNQNGSVQPESKDVSRISLNQVKITLPK
jgi:hypothetical protein